MSENKVKWHPYPQEKPSKKGYYLVSITSKIESYRRIYIEEYRIIGNRYMFSEIFAKDISAWAELPEPYKGNCNG